MGKEIPGDEPYANLIAPNLPGSEMKGDVGSIIIVIATDAAAPCLHQAQTPPARRASLGLARTGSISGNGSGDDLHRFLHGQPACR